MSTNPLEHDPSRSFFHFSVARWVYWVFGIHLCGKSWENWPSSNDGRLGNKIDIPTAASEDELRNALGCAEGGRSRIRMKLPSGLLTNEKEVSRNLWFVMHAKVWRSSNYVTEYRIPLRKVCPGKIICKQLVVKTMISYLLLHFPSWHRQAWHFALSPCQAF